MAVTTEVPWLAMPSALEVPNRSWVAVSCTVKSPGAWSEASRKAALGLLAMLAVPVMVSVVAVAAAGVTWPFHWAVSMPASPPDKVDEASDDLPSSK